VSEEDTMAMNYKKTVLRDRPEFAGRRLCVADPDGPGLLLGKNKEPVSVIIDPESGEAKFSRIDAKSLRDLGRQVFGWDDPSVPTVLRRLVTPEMEIERLLNCYRHKYLLCLDSRGKSRAWVAERLSAAWNDLYLVLIGATLRNDPGGRRGRALLRESGFDPDDLSHDFEQEKSQLKQMKDLLLKAARPNSQARGETYRELIAMKPGFHELWYRPGDHRTYNEELLDRVRGTRTKSGRVPADVRRCKVLLSFHGSMESQKIDLATVGNELGSFWRFSPCHATEGPCFLRRSARLPLRSLLLQIAQEASLQDDGQPALKKGCLVYDYRAKLCDGRSSLRSVLKQTEKFTRHALRWE